MKRRGVIISVIISVIILLSLSFSYDKPTDYTNLTQGIKPYPDIAIDMKKEYQEQYIRALWKSSYDKWSKK